jgi:chitodextrinase
VIAQKPRLPMRPLPPRGSRTLRGVVATVILTAGLTVSLATASATTARHHATPNAVHRNVRCRRVAHKPRHACKGVHAAKKITYAVTITSGPAPGSVSSSSSASFGFTTRVLNATLRCSLDASAYANCSSPMGYAGLSQGSHTFRVEAVANGATSKPATDTWTVNSSVSGFDTIPPSTPTGLAATAGDTQVTVSWNGSTDNVGVAGYYLYRNGNRVAQTTATTYNDTGLTNGTSYSYTVIAFDAAGNSSTASGAISATPHTAVTAPDTTPPSSPAGARATAGNAQVAVSWSASTDNVGVAGYRVYRNGGQVAQTTATAFTDSGLSNSTTYSYTMVAFDAAGNVSTASSGVSATPVAPTSGNPPPPIQAWVPANGSSFTPLSDSAAAADVIPTAEVHPANNVPNHTVPTGAQLQSFHGALDVWGRSITAVNPYFKYVTGNFTGTTDEIIQWGAWKWGIPEDWLRAEYSQESMWKQAALGDRKTVTAAAYALYPSQARIPNSLDVYQSMGLTQVKWTPNGSVGAGTEPMRWTSTAFNVDYQLASIRYLFDNPQGLTASFQTSNYFSGNGWDSLGGWFEYYPWLSPGQMTYITAVQGRLAVRTWTLPGF